MTVTETTTKLTVNIDGANFTFAPSQVTEIAVLGTSGDDTVNVNSLNNGTRFVASCGSGDDTVTVNWP